MMEKQKIATPMPAPRIIKTPKKEKGAPEYILFQPTVEDPISAVREEYCAWARSDREVDGRFKKWLTPAAVQVRIEWKVCRTANLRGEIEVRLTSGKTQTITPTGKGETQLVCGLPPLPWHEKCKFLDPVYCDSEETLLSVLDDRDATRAKRALRVPFSEERDYLTSLRDKILAVDKSDATRAQFAASIAKITHFDKTDAQIIVYPIYTVEIAYRGKTYGGMLDGFLSAPLYAPESREIIRWRRRSSFNRHVSFFLFLLSLAASIALQIAGQGDSATVEGGGIPLILSGFWLFPINIAGVALPYFIYDNDAFDLYDYKDKAKFYRVYNLIYLAAALLFVGGAYLAAFLIWH